MPNKIGLRIVSLLATLALVAGCRPGTDIGQLGDDLRYAIVAGYTGLTAREVDTADLTPMADTAVNRFGINVFLEQEVEEWKIRRTLEMAREAGFRWVKQQVRWADIETPAKGQHYDVKNGVTDTWAKYDLIVDLARAYGHDLILRLDTTPEWARMGKPKEETPPDRFEDYGDFVYAVLARYKGRVKYYQIWNEPNLPFEWGGNPPDPEQYVRLLRIAYTRAKEADPGARIISAALAPTIELSARGIDDLLFLQKMYDAGAAPYFDVLGANAYGLRSGPDDRRLDEKTDVNFSRPLLIRELMVRNGDAAKAVWVSEMGWNALPADFTGEANWGRVTLEQQAAYTVRAYQRMREEWPWLGVAALWHFRMVHDVNRDKPQYYFGIVENDFTPLPVYDAVKRYASAPPVLFAGFHQHSDPAIAFKGGWREEGEERATLGSRLVGGPEALARFQISGGDLDLVVSRNAQSGRLLVTIDGGAYAANRLARDQTGQAYVDLWSEASRWQERVPVARGLPWGRHDVALRVIPGHEGGAVAALDGVIVAGVPPNASRTAATVALPLIGAFTAYVLGRNLFRRSRRGRGERVLGIRRWLAVSCRSTGVAAAASVSRFVRPVVARLSSLPRYDDRVSDWLTAHPAVPLAILGAIVLLSWALRLYRLDGQSLWYDEGSSAVLARRDLAAITAGAAADIHPPLYYYLLHFWSLLTGTGEFALRFLSVLFGTMTISLTYLLGRRLFGLPVGLAAALFAAASPVLVYYGQEARMYMQLTALATLSTYLFVRLFVDRDPAHRHLLWLGYLASGIAMLYTHYFAFPVLLAHNLYFLASWLWPRSSARRLRDLAVWAAGQTLLALAFLPWLAIASRQLSAWPAISDSFALPTLAHRVLRVFAFGVGWDAGYTPRREIAVLFILAAAACFLLLRPTGRWLSRAFLVALATGLPLVVMYLLSLQRPMYNPKFVLPAATGFLVFVALGAYGGGALAGQATRWAIGNRWAVARHTVVAITTLVALAAFLYANSAGLLAYYHDSKYARDDYRGLASYVAEQSSEGDAVILNAPGQAEIFDYYYSGKLPRYPLPKSRPMDEAATAADLESIALRHRRVWVVEWAVAESDPRGYVRAWLEGRGASDVDITFGNVRLLRYIAARAQ